MSRSYEERVGSFKPGSIRRIKLRNFLTYDAVEFFPGPRLNIVMGPNGTGKSTILNATCLGLGGEPALLGRADDARKFITHGKDKCLIEVELEPQPKQEVHVFRRIIDANKGSERGRGKGASAFFINGEKVTIKDVQEVVSSVYQISIDNLCTFLPQDRVGSFSGFNAQALMHETEKSMSASKHLYETHMSLIEKEQELLSGDTNVEAIEDKLTRLESDLARMEREKERMEEREEAVEQAELLEKKLAWLKYDILRTDCIALKQERDQIKKDVEAAVAKVQPLQDKHAELNAQKRQLDARFVSVDGEIESCKRESTKQKSKYETHWDKIDEDLSELNMTDSHRRQAEANAEKEREKIAKYAKLMEESPSREELEAAQRQAANEYRKLRAPVDKANTELKRLHEQLKESKHESNNLEDRLKRMNDEKANRRQRIFQELPQLRKISEWLDNNRTIFRRRVWGPIVCEVVTRSGNTAAYLEQHVPNSTLKSFVVECREDYDLLYREVRQKYNMPINIITVKDGALEDVQRIYSDDKYQTLKREHGVMGYMDESFTAPAPIMQALRSSANVHKVLIGGEDTQRSLDNRGLLDFLSEPENGETKLKSACIFSSQGRRSFKYSSQVSRYTGKPSVRVDEITSARMLAPGINPAAKAKIERDLEEVLAQQEDIKRRCREAEKDVQSATREIQDAKERALQAKREVEDQGKLQSKLTNAQRKLQRYEEEASVDNSGQKQRIVRQLMNRVANCITALESHATSHRELMKLTFENAGIRMDQDGVTVAERQARNLLMDARQEFDLLNQKKAQINQTFKAKKQKLAAAAQAAREVAPLEDSDGNELPIKAQLEALPVATVAEAQAAYDEAMAKINGIESNPDAIRQYEQLQAQAEKTREDLELVKDSKGAKLREIEQTRETWEAALQSSVSRVNVLFSDYMAELGCAGQVVLKRGGRPESSQNNGSEQQLADGNFKEWGIEIQVKFREKSKFEVLSAQRQSGGERSVSTIMYLMALQDLMVCPFRFVDEINQGLDERNERLVFRRIVRNSTKSPPRARLDDHCGQYFLITPKLLPNLYDMEEEAVKVHIITNGPFTFSKPTDFNPDRFVEMASGEDEEVKEDQQVEVEDESANQENNPSVVNEGGSQSRKKRRVS